MREDFQFLYGRIKNNDLITVDVIGVPGPQQFRARVERIYSTRKGISTTLADSEIQFVGGSGWGDVPLAIGDRALLFIRSIGSKFYEASAKGHFILEMIDGHQYASIQFPDLWLSEDAPAWIRECARQDPKRPYASLVPFEVIETYLVSLIRKFLDSSGEKAGTRQNK